MVLYDFIIHIQVGGSKSIATSVPVGVIRPGWFYMAQDCYLIDS